MRRIVCVCAALMVLASGCGKSEHEKLMQSMLDKMNEMTSILKTVKDEASANAAALKIKGMSQELQDLAKRGKELAEPTKDQKDALEKAYKEKVTEASKQVAAEMMRIMQDPKLAEPMAGAFRTLEDITP